MAPTDKRVRLSIEQKSKLIEESLQPGFKRSKACEKYGISLACLSMTLKNKETILKSADTFGKQGFKTKVNKKTLKVANMKFWRKNSSLFEFEKAILQKKKTSRIFKV